MVSHKADSILKPVRPTASYVRQALSAVRVISILRDECPDDLSPLPVVTYALSLSLSIFYRQFRQSNLKRHRNRAKGDLKTCCALLERVKSTWWSAGAMAELGKSALSKADVSSTGSNPERETLPDDVASGEMGRSTSPADYVS